MAVPYGCHCHTRPPIDREPVNTLCGRHYCFKLEYHLDFDRHHLRCLHCEYCPDKPAAWLGAVTYRPNNSTTYHLECRSHIETHPPADYVYTYQPFDYTCVQLLLGLTALQSVQAYLHANPAPLVTCDGVAIKKELDTLGGIVEDLSNQTLR